MSSSATRKPPSGMTRWFFRQPIHLYRWRMGWVMGDRFLLLNHVGRNSGRPRQAVVEVVRHDPESDCYVICSGWGEQSQWYQNVMAAPDVSIVVGRRRLAVHAQRLDAEAAGAAMVDYAARHPGAARKLAGYLGFESDGGDESYRQVGAALPFLRLCPREVGTGR